MPRYPEIRVSSASRNPLAMVAAVRLELRRAGVRPAEIEEFSREALTREDPLGILRVCRAWVGKAESARSV